MVTGTYPFDSATKNRAEVFQKIQKGQYTFPPGIESKLSNECKDLIRKMIVVDRTRRVTGEQALNHPWFEKCLVRKEGNQDLVAEGVLSKLRQFKGSSTLRKAALNVLVKMLSPTDIENLRQLFQSIDTDNSGFIEIAELEKALNSHNHQIGAQELKKIISELDYNGNQLINYTEFLAATISVQKFLTHQKLEAIFRQFDIDGNNMITKENIKDAMSKMGREISDEEINEIMRKLDSSGDQAISLDEFKKMIMEGEE